MTNLRLKKGDKVIILAGKDKGKVGPIERVFVKTGQIIVSGMNIVKKHTKATKKNPAGGLIEMSRPLPTSRVQLLCPSCNKPTRVGYIKQGKTKERVCKKCGKAIHIEAKEAKEK
jgi:large subunit ribosomal protein L24